MGYYFSFSLVFVSHWPLFSSWRVIFETFSTRLEATKYSVKPNSFAFLIPLTGAAGATCSSSAMMTVEMSVSNKQGRKWTRNWRSRRFFIVAFRLAGVIQYVRAFTEKQDMMTWSEREIKKYSEGSGYRFCMKIYRRGLICRYHNKIRVLDILGIKDI